MVNSYRRSMLFLVAGALCLVFTSSPSHATGTGYAEVQTQARAAIRNGALVIDVRTTAEFAQGHIDGALNIPYDELRDRTAEIPGERDRVIILYCRSGRRSGIAEKILLDEGFTRAINAGGYEGLKAALKPGE